MGSHLSDTDCAVYEGNIREGFVCTYVAYFIHTSYIEEYTGYTVRTAIHSGTRNFGGEFSPEGNAEVAFMAKIHES